MEPADSTLLQTLKDLDTEDRPFLDEHSAAQLTKILLQVACIYFTTSKHDIMDSRG